MSKVNNGTAAIKTVSHRNILNKELYQPDDFDILSKEFHLELGEQNQAVIVEDRPVDWSELQNRDVDQVGLANILELARRRGDDLSKFAYQDSEGIDLSELDPMDPNGVKSVIASQSESSAKLDAIAKQLGVSTDELVKAFMEGTFADLVQNAAKTEVKEGEE